MTKVTQLSLGEDGGLGRRRIHLREISGDSESPLETVGQDLRAARLRRGDDLATVSRSLKIRKDHLEAVEEDNLEGLPGKTYAIGFVRSYAAYLGLDAVQMVERFKQEISGRHDEQQAAAPMMSDEEGRKLPQGWRIVAGVVVLALVYGAWHLVSAGPEPETVPAPPVVIHAPPAPPPPAPLPAAQTEATPGPALQRIPAPAQGAATQPAKPGLASAVTAGSAQPSPTASMVAVPAVPSASGQIYGAQNKTARVILRARGDTHIVVRGRDGMVYINRPLKSGDSYQVPNVPGLTLSSTNAGAVELDLDGLAIGRAGAPQETAGDIDLNPQAIVDRSNNR